jgi:SAM-dependent methyltransferase
MIKVARRRIDAEIGDLLTLDPAVRVWDLAFGGLNVFQYLHHSDFEIAVRKVAGVLKPGGYFLGDFITSDHIRWYPNLVYSGDHKILSFRTPTLTEKDNYMYQRSRIINIDFRNGMRITDEGTHERFLPPLLAGASCLRNSLRWRRRRLRCRQPGAHSQTGRYLSIDPPPDLCAQMK